jgi:glycolate oxidase FAD binding subunit
MMPGDEQAVLEIVRSAMATETPLAVRGRDTKRGLGRPNDLGQTLSTQALTGVTLYEPAELVLSARAGTPLSEIRALLDQRGQEFAFEPMDHALFYGGAPGEGTLGGMVAVNASGPRRIKSGAARDHVLGFRCVTGRGDIVKSGGRVMKNVTGYDLSKLIAGSYGTLCVLTEITMKVLPKAETERTLLVGGLDESAALRVLREASGTPHEVSSFAVLPSGAEPLRQAGVVGCLRLEGPEVSVLKRRDDIAAHFAATGAAFETLDEVASRALWISLRDAVPLTGSHGPVWRISVAPTAGGELVEGLRRAGVAIERWFYDWAGGLVWIAADAGAPDGHAGLIRAAVDRIGGHALLMRAPDALRDTIPVFHPQPAALAALSLRVKDSFDPLHLLERGRMRADF